MIDFESPSVRTLLTLAERHPEIDTAACTLVFAHLHSADRFRRDLRHALALRQLSDLQFATLVLLYAVEPEAMPMAALARKSGVSRSAITDAFDGLIRSGLVSRDRDSGDRRIVGGRITATGRQTTEQAMDDYLRAVMRAAPTQILDGSVGAAAGKASKPSASAQYVGEA